MCVAVPGEIISMDGDTATVDFFGNQMRVSLGLVDANIGDHVLVHAGCAIEVMRREQAEELLALLAELDEVLAPEREGRVR
jgi:hydrogenase expression/formation protein HypC